jgi:hypothetical protein
MVSTLLVFFFTFLLAYISCTGGFNVRFTYYKVPWLGSSPPLFSLSVLSSYAYIKCMHHIDPPLPSPFSHCYPHLTGPVLHSCLSLFNCMSKGFHHGTSPVNILYFNQSNSLYYSSLPIPPILPPIIP